MQSSLKVVDKNAPTKASENQKPDNSINIPKFNHNILTEPGTEKSVLSNKNPIFMPMEQDKIKKNKKGIATNVESAAPKVTEAESEVTEVVEEIPDALYQMPDYFSFVETYGLVHLIRFYHVFTIFMFAFIGHEVSFFVIMFLKFAPYFMDPTSELKKLFVLCSNDIIYVRGESHFFDILFMIVMFRSRVLRCVVISYQMFYPILPFISNFMALIPKRIKNHVRVEEIRKSIDPYYFTLIDPYCFTFFYSYDAKIVLNTFAFLLSVISFKFAVWVTTLILAGVAFLNYMNRFLQNDLTQNQNLYCLVVILFCLIMFIKLYENTILMILLMIMLSRKLTHINLLN